MYTMLSVLGSGRNLIGEYAWLHFLKFWFGVCCISNDVLLLNCMFADSVPPPEFKFFMQKNQNYGHCIRFFGRSSIIPGFQALQEQIIGYWATRSLCCKSENMLSFMLSSTIICIKCSYVLLFFKSS